MDSIPWQNIFAAIGGVAIMAGVASVVYQWAIRYESGGPFSGVLSAIGVTGAVSLALLGGGLLVAVGWLLDLIPDGGF